MDVQFVVAPSGDVAESSVASSTLGDEDTETCIADAAKRWKFPKPDGGANVVITYPFVLAPG